MKILIALILMAGPVWAQDSCPPVPDHATERAQIMAVLAHARDETEARFMADRLWQIWTDAPDAKAQALLDEGMQRRLDYDFAGSRAVLDGNVKPALTSIAMDLRRVWNVLFCWVFGYGHFPARSLRWAAGIWAFSFWLYGQTYATGQMAPNSAVVLTSEDWMIAVNAGCPVAVHPLYVAAKDSGCKMPLTLWEGSASYKDYETFSAGLYALDLFLPLDSLAQQEAWAPSKDRGNWGWWGFYLRFVIQLSGWIIAAVGAAVVTGLVGKRDE